MSDATIPTPDGLTEDERAMLTPYEHTTLVSAIDMLHERRNVLIDPTFVRDTLRALAKARLAVNAHDDLLAACKAALETFDRLEEAYPTKFGGVGGMFDRHAPEAFSLGTLRAAIRKAEAKAEPQGVRP
jgi:hypothetical protein